MSPKVWGEKSLLPTDVKKFWRPNKWINLEYKDDNRLINKVKSTSGILFHVTNHRICFVS